MITEKCTVKYAVPQTMFCKKSVTLSVGRVWIQQKRRFASLGCRCKPVVDDQGKMQKPGIVFGVVDLIDNAPGLCVGYMNSLARHLELSEQPVA